MRTAVLIASLLLASAALAQTSIEGQVTDAAGRALPNSEVSLQRSGLELRRITGVSGGFRFVGVEAGEYEVKVTANGYFPTEYEIVVKPRQPVSLQIELRVRPAVQQTVEVRSENLSVAETASSRLLTRDELDRLPALETRDLPTLALNTFPGATLSHDNFVHVRGNEVSLHEFINGVSFLENPQQQFSPALNPRIFETINMVSGSFPAEFGNRFGGVLDTTVRAGNDLRGQGSVEAGVGTFDTHDAFAEYGGTHGRFGYYTFASGFTSGWYLNPPEPRQVHDFGAGGTGGAHFDWRGNSDHLQLFMSVGKTNFQLPNLSEDQEVGRNAKRRLNSQTAILTWRHTFSPDVLLTTSAYERTVGDRLLPTADLITPFGAGSRATLNGGVKTDLVVAVRRHIFKAGVDLTRIRLRESFAFDGREAPPPPDEPEPFVFRGRVAGGQAALYAQDHITLTPNLSADLGVRWDYFDVTNTYAQVSPRVALAYHIRRTGSVLHFAYNRFFSPFQVEYALLANYFGTQAPELPDRVGPLRPYRQNYFEWGLTQELHPRASLEVTGFLHRGDHPIEYREISITRLFLPINSSHAHAYGADVVLNLKQLEHVGISGRLQYAYQKTYFYGPLAGGFAVGEEIESGRRFLPAFDEAHSGTGTVFYRRKWRDTWGAFNLRFGSGTALENGRARVPGHVSAGLAAGMNVWSAEHKRVDFEFNVANLGDNRYRVSKESEETPVQFTAPRIVAARVKFRF